ncbi:response regulator transcription factor [Paenibacillus arenilitoris]|uniref:Response regulator n=1 Tax=Paenibacillus arenilitoris TaxID=2772299 RepID=A0A927CJW1_9BACL|nr:response regulator [Paenibacillus arenilitoris]MBD2868815.1 response regulator [Paenibacillus arenilitoris]
MKILIVDDEPLILGGLVKVVKEVAPVCTEVQTAGHAREAIEKMKSYMPDVMITDLHMPEQNGFQLIEEARESGLCDRFIILTGYDEFEYVRRALRCGVIDYLLKPIDRDEIAILLNRVREELPSAAATESEYRHHAQKILSYMEENFMEDISLDKLADLVNLHPNYISSLFKKETGSNFVNYLHEIRIREAKKLLESEQYLTISLIGQQVGYEDKHYFSKVFKKYTGRTPGSYRGIAEGVETEDSLDE